MSLINREDLLKKFESGALLFEPSIREIIEAEATVDAVPVIRCKDCKQYQEWMGGNVCLHRVTCSYRDPSPNGYCSYAERKDDEA